jgi:hypothetical protein
MRKEATETLANAKQKLKDVKASDAAAKAATDAHRKADEAARVAAQEQADAAAKYHAKLERLNSFLAAELASESR